MSNNSNRSAQLDFKKIIDQIPNALLIIDADRIIYANRAAECLLAQDDLLSICGLSIDTFVNLEDMPLIYHTLNKISRRENSRETLQLSLHSGAATQISAELTFQAFDEQDGQLVQLSICDVSARKAVEESMIQSEKLSIIGELSAGIIHEIRNPLTSIKGFLQLMQTSGRLNRDYLNIIMREIKQIEKITGELLYFTRSKKNRIAPVDLRMVAEETIQLFEAQAEGRHIQLIFDSDHQHAHRILGERTQLKQVFVNLIKNAMEAIATEGTVTIRLFSDSEWEHATIQDTGDGIPKEILGNLGKSFFTTKTSGTGLGLMVTYTIIRNHKGTIAVTSEKNRGTTFHLRFPKPE